MKNEDEPVIHTLYIVGARAVVAQSRRKPFIALFYLLAHNSCVNQNEYLSFSFQLMEHSVHVDLNLSDFLKLIVNVVPNPST